MYILMFCIPGCQSSQSGLQVEYASGVVHANIVQLLDVFAEGDRYVIVVSNPTAALHTAISS